MARHATIDFETFSRADLLKVGAAAYSQHPSTKILMMAWRVPHPKSSGLWLPGDPFPKELADWIAQSLPIEAHNAMFEIHVWRNVGRVKNNFPAIARDQWRCSLAKAAYNGLPLSLENLGHALNLSVIKDAEGAAAMKRITKPTKEGLEPTPETHLEDFMMTASYCATDTQTEELASEAMGDLPPSELANWQADIRMQDRGLLIDQDLCEAAISLMAEYKKKRVKKLIEITDGKITTGDQLKRIKEHILEHEGIEVKSLDKDGIKELLDNPEISDVTRQILEIRRDLGLKSAAKYGSALGAVCNDGRVRGATLYYGATTGRNVGRLFQPLNMRRPVYCSDMELLSDLIKSRSSEMIEEVVGAPLPEVLADAVRSMIIAGPGNILVSGDFSAIESVVTFGIAGETSALDRIRKGADLYCWFASEATNREVLGKKHPDHSERDALDRQLIGKPGMLAFGFAGGVGAWRNFDKTDAWTDEKVNEFKNVWRDRHPKVTKLWDIFDTYMKRAITNKGKVYEYHPEGNPACKIEIYYDGSCLRVRLPSKRELIYNRPQIMESEAPWSTEDDPKMISNIMYWTRGGEADRRKAWFCNRGWRGIWIENIVQAIARDIMICGARTLEKNGYPPILTVYDQVLSERKKEGACAEEFAELMCRDIPDYAKDWPIEADAWIGPCFRKD